MSGFTAIKKLLCATPPKSIKAANQQVLKHHTAAGTYEKKIDIRQSAINGFSFWVVPTELPLFFFHVATLPCNSQPPSLLIQPPSLLCCISISDFSVRFCLDVSDAPLIISISHCPLLLLGGQLFVLDSFMHWVWRSRVRVVDEWGGCDNNW